MLSVSFPSNNPYRMQHHDISLNEDFITQAGGQKTFSVKSQMVNILGFAGHELSIATTLLSFAAARNSLVWLCSNQALFIRVAGLRDLAPGLQFSNGYRVRDFIPSPLSNSYLKGEFQLPSWKILNKCSHHWYFKALTLVS